MRRWLKIVLALLAVAGGVLATLPWWLGPAARPLAKSFGVTFAHYERLGYTRLRVSDLRLERPQVTVTVGRIEAATPLVWAWKFLRHREPLVTVDHWRVETRPATQAGRPRVVTGMPTLHALLLRVEGGLKRWLPRAEARDGAVEWPHGGLTVARADWRREVLTVRGLKLYGRALDGTVTTPEPGVIAVRVTNAMLDAAADLAWRGADVRGTGRVWDQPAEVQAHFADIGWLPDNLTARAENWDVAAERLRLGAQYQRVRGDARLDWHDGGFTFDLMLKASPQADAKAPAFEVRAAAQGDAKAITVNALHVDVPFASADLTAPVRYDFDSRAPLKPATFTLEADLARQPWLDLAGTLKGQVRIEDVEQAAKLEFQLEGSEVRRGDLVIPQAVMRGNLQWPRMELAQLDLQLGEADRLSAHGTIDWRQRVLEDVVVHAEFGSALVGRWLPHGTNWKQVAIDAQLSGPLAAPEHHGKLALQDAHFGALRMFDVDAEWQGRGAGADRVEVAVTNDRARLEATGSASRRDVALHTLTVHAPDGDTLSLTGPARIGWTPVLAISGVQLQGAHSRLVLSATGGENGAFDVEATGFGSALVDAWLPLAGPDWSIRHWQASGQVADGTLRFTTELAGGIQASDHGADVVLKAQGDAEGVRLNELNVTKDGRVLTHAAGRLPLVWTMASRPHWQLDRDAPLELDVNSEPDSPLWPMLAAQAGVELTAAAARAKLSGSLHAPQGDLQVTVGRIRMLAGKPAGLVPDIDELVIEAHADRGRIALTSLSGRVAGQTVTAQALLPMDDQRWNELWRGPRTFDWSRGEGRLEVIRADLAPIARHIAAFPLAQGWVDARIEARGGKLSGTLQLHRAISRPLGALGIVQAINADLALDGRRLEVRSFAGQLGGEAVTLQGSIDWPAGAPEPVLALTLQGRDLPLVRRPGLLLRGDLDLAARTDAAAVTHITGTATLHDSLVLADLATLLPTGRRGVDRQPSYFSVATAPFNRWQLGVEIRGVNALHLRTTVFKGTASPHFQLSGTLGEPRAVGELTVDQAQVLFPFATFAVQLGVVRLRAADPYHPVLLLNAVSRRHDYELRLKVTGSPEAPNVTFSSNPPLEAAQVLLMVMTGQSPAEDSAAGMGGQRLTQLGAYLGRGLFGGLSGDESRLEVVSGEQTSQQGRETYGIEYKLNDRWSLTGEYDRFDDYNAGLKWRVYTQESKPREKK